MSNLLRDIPMPTIVEPIDYETIVQRKLDRVKEILAQEGIEYIPSEADDIMTLIEMDAYEEMLLRTALNERIKQQFLVYATGSNLDHIGVTRFGVARLNGTKPTARFRFELTQTRLVDTVIPRGLMLGDGERIAVLTDSVTIRAGETSAEGMAELDDYTATSDAKTETILTPVPWAMTATQLTQYAGGAYAEDDERYRDRIWLGRDRRSTAGARETYRYYAMSADARIVDVAVRNGGAGIVEVAVLTEGYDTPPAVVDAVDVSLNAEEVRPITDDVRASAAVIRDVTVEATLYAVDPSLVDTGAIDARFDPFMGRIGAKLSVAKIYDLLQDENILDVVLSSPTNSVNAAWNEALRITINLSIEAAT